MIKRSGYADLPLHTGTVPKWLADRMMRLGTLIIEALVLKYGKKEVLIRLSDPLWFQSLGAVLGMDWHSSGITTSVMYALKRGLNRRAKELGIVVCGGRGKYSRRTPEELQILADMTGMDGNKLINCSKLAAKVDGTALQDHVTEELTRQARCRASEEDMVPEEMFWEDYESIIADWSSYAVSFDESGMTVAFSPYELAAYAAGAQEFTLTYEELAPHLNQRGQQVLGLAE